jgi:hypothetical protein
MGYPFDKPGIYAIHVAGEVDERWSDRLGGMTIIKTVTAEEEPKPVSVLIGLLADQAALSGVLDTLYQNRYQLLYVKYLGAHEGESPIDINPTPLNDSFEKVRSQVTEST